jgi:hypothetical protein
MRVHLFLRVVAAWIAAGLLLMVLCMVLEIMGVLP